MSDTGSLRNAMRERRRSLEPETLRTAGKQAARLLSAQTEFNDASHIACYWPVNGEMDCQPIMQHVWRSGKTCYLPVLDTDSGNSLWFAPYHENTPMLENRFGIPEPEHAIEHRTPAAQLDLVLLPVVAFDARGNRLGMGAGYYDRTLAFRKQADAPARPFLIGLAHDFQRVAALENNDWDVPLDGIVTELHFQRV
jgi:5-formyltetrahydrofolate cyclo-ligase